MEQDAKQIDSVTSDKREDNRRQTSVMTLAGAIRHQRRRTHRRNNDHINNYIDWYGHWPFAATLIITLLCFADAFLTIVLLSNGAVELNILMDWLIQRDVHTFTVVKMAVTGTALLILVMHFNFRIYRFIAVRYLIYALVPLYSLLILHEINMLANL
ncbi:MAG TPA: DUF5658 family protein [Gammaproteobacteria bacterium]|nr:DUF5658 family protein [Gammaproteobacteria bacterium]